LLLALVPLTGLGEQSSDPWESATGLDFSAALQRFEEARRTAPTDTRLMLGHASVLLNRQPVTSANIEHATSLLREVDADIGAPPPRRATARYLLGRIAQDHLDSPDLETARDCYVGVMRDFPSHPLAGQAAVNLGLMLRWSKPGLPPEEIASGLEKLLTDTTAPEARRELLFLLGELRRKELADSRGARDALLAARVIGFETRGRNGDVDLLLAALSRELNDPTAAAAHYQAFVRDHPRDSRTTTVRRLAAELADAHASPP
jgi:hypothetical protein